jgi:hypothetical protein
MPASVCSLAFLDAMSELVLEIGLSLWNDQSAQVDLVDGWHLVCSGTL